jgi:hypothetical protein
MAFRHSNAFRRSTHRAMARLATLFAILVVTATFDATPLALATESNANHGTDAAVTRGVDWLLAQQQPNGAWRSKTYAQLQAGPAATALAVAALAQVTSNEPEALAPGSATHQAINNALPFLVKNLAPAGHVRSPDNASEYPTYATALTLIALEQLKPSDREPNADVIRRMRAYLVAAQVTAPPNDGGVAANDAGAWGLVGGDPEDPSSFRTANVSTTRFALEALRPVADDHPETFRRARRFLKRLQNSDGGFAFVGDPLDPLNKAGAFPLGGNAGPFVTVRSYGTATTDGLLAMLAAGRAIDEPRVARAIGWLNAHPQVDAVPGFPSDEVSTAAAQGLFYYYAAALAQAMAAFPDAPFAAHAPDLAAELVSRQRLDGSWVNTIATMREDDPLTATCFALEALTTLRDLKK